MLRCLPRSCFVDSKCKARICCRRRFPRHCKMCRKRQTYVRFSVFFHRKSSHMMPDILMLTAIFLCLPSLNYRWQHCRAVVHRRNERPNLAASIWFFNLWPRLNPLCTMRAYLVTNLIRVHHRMRLINRQHMQPVNVYCNAPQSRLMN